MKITQMNVEITSQVLELEKMLDMYKVTNIEAVKKCRTFGVITNMGPSILKYDKRTSIMDLNYKMIKIDDFNEKIHPLSLSEMDVFVLHKDVTKIGMMLVKGPIEKYHNSYIFSCIYNDIDMNCTIFMKDVLKVVLCDKKTNKPVSEFSFKYGIKEPVPRNWTLVKTILLINGIFLVDDIFRYIKISSLDNIEIKYGEYNNLNHYGINDKRKFDVLANIIVYNDGIYQIYKRRGNDDLYNIEYLTVDASFLSTSSIDILRDKSIIINI